MYNFKQYEDSVLNIPRPSTGFEKILELTEAEAIHKLTQMKTMDYFSPFGNFYHQKSNSSLDKQIKISDTKRVVIDKN